MFFFSFSKIMVYNNYNFENIPYGLFTLHCDIRGNLYRDSMRLYICETKTEWAISNSVFWVVWWENQPVCTYILISFGPIAIDFLSGEGPSVSWSSLPTMTSPITLARACCNTLLPTCLPFSIFSFPFPFFHLSPFLVPILLSISISLSSLI